MPGAISLMCETGTSLARFAGELDLYSRGGCRTDIATLAPVHQPTSWPLDKPLERGLERRSVWLDSSEAEVGVDPFPYLVAAGAIEEPYAEGLLRFLHSGARWRVNEGGFYRAMECDLLGEAMPTEMLPLLSPSTLRALETQVSSIFCLKLGLTGAIAGHRLDSGNGIGIHSDRPRPGEETHRLLITLADEPYASAGGHFLLLSSPEPSSLRRIIPLQHNLAIAFPLTDHSFHAVTTMRFGCRFSVLFSFRAPDSAELAEACGVDGSLLS